MEAIDRGLLILTMSTEDSTDTAGDGSWAPFLILVFVLVLRWIMVGESGLPIRIRRWYQTKRVQIKKRMGLRDDSKYKNFAAGDGSNLKYKRQG